MYVCNLYLDTKIIKIWLANVIEQRVSQVKLLVSGKLKLLLYETAKMLVVLTIYLSYYYF